jgi:glycosyltransferase involved in cell wall biosynthesis
MESAQAFSRMRILLANYRYFVSGGPERYMFNVTDALTTRGHEIIPFSIHYTRNRPTPYAQYFVKPLGSEDQVFFREQRFTPQTFWRTLSRLFYARDVEKAVTRIAADTQPQIAYVLHYLRKLSPSLLVGLKKAGLPIVVRLSDYAMLCPQAHCLRDERPCEFCVHGNLWPSIRYHCVQGNLAASVLNALATWYHRARGFFNLIDVFVTTTEFMYNLMLSAGFPESRLRWIPTFVDGAAFRPNLDFAKDNYIVYSGRLEATKGLHVLVDALAVLKRKRPDLSLRLRVAGWGSESYDALIKQNVQRAGLQDVVQFVGVLDVNELSSLLSKAQLSVVPSLWYENLPNVLLESLASGTPVLASRLGSLTEYVKDGETGYLFQPGDADSLAERIAYCLDHPREVAAMSQKARQVAEDVYSQEQHLETLEALFAELVRGK